MDRIQQAIEQLQCAEINCDNVKRIGPVAAEMAKMQIQEAIKLLEGTSLAEVVAKRVAGEIREARGG